MAFLAQPRGALFQQGRVVGTVRCMAIGAIIKHGRMLPEERAALLGMAGIASFIGGIFNQQFWPGRTVGIVTFRTGSLANQDGVSREQMDFRPLRLMASEADIRLADSLQHLVFGHMGSMAVAARHALHLVLAAAPMGAQAALMTSDAFLILGGCGRWLIGFGFRAKHNVGGRTAFLVGVALQVGVTLTVAGLA